MKTLTSSARVCPSLHSIDAKAALLLLLAGSIIFWKLFGQIVFPSFWAFYEPLLMLLIVGFN
jgi:hypothetical protein